MHDYRPSIYASAGAVILANIAVSAFSWLLAFIFVIPLTDALGYEYTGGMMPVGMIIIVAVCVILLAVAAVFAYCLSTNFVTGYNLSLGNGLLAVIAGSIAGSLGAAIEVFLAGGDLGFMTGLFAIGASVYVIYTRAV